MSGLGDEAKVLRIRHAVLPDVVGVDVDTVPRIIRFFSVSHVKLPGWDQEKFTSVSGSDNRR